MQYHLNGFHPGDPRAASSAPSQVLPEKVDVLIVGCGPAGLTLATQLAAFSDITTCVVEQKPGPLVMGQADGIACRSMEMFEAFGFSERVLREAYWVNEVTFWKPDPNQPTQITRSSRIQDTEDGLSEFPHVILSQARVHDFYLEAMRSAAAPLDPHYALKVAGIKVDHTASHPVTVTLQQNDGTPRTIRARYVVGCDGARSVVRSAMGLALVGDAANQAWGVMDVLVQTDFPDIRMKSVIHSATEGSVLIIPREGGYLVRLYIELDKLNPDERVAARNITQDSLIAAAQRILHPYTLEVKEVAWWSVYEIGQRLCDRFDDGDGDSPPHVFIAGDAGHTHSPKAGQGMNMSMADAFNLGWKLAAVLRGQARPDLLLTYSQERQAVAQELIDFDRDLARMFSTKPKGQTEKPQADPAAFQRYFVKHGRFTAGTSIHYGQTLLSGDDTHQGLATGFPIGMRFHSAPVIRLADARPMQLGHMLKADGRWRIVAFADETRSDLNALCHFLADNPASPMRAYTPAGQDIDAVIDLRAVMQQGFRDLEWPAFPILLRPGKGCFGLTDTEKLFCVDPVADIFDLRGIDREQGAMVIVRPDQYVGHVLPLTDHTALSAYFARFLRPLA